MRGRARNLQGVFVGLPRFLHGRINVFRLGNDRRVAVLVGFAGRLPNTGKQLRKLRGIRFVVRFLGCRRRFGRGKRFRRWRFFPAAGKHEHPGLGVKLPGLALFVVRQFGHGRLSAAFQGLRSFLGRCWPGVPADCRIGRKGLLDQFLVIVVVQPAGILGHQPLAAGRGVIVQCPLFFRRSNLVVAAGQPVRKVLVLFLLAGLLDKIHLPTVFLAEFALSVPVQDFLFGLAALLRHLGHGRLVQHLRLLFLLLLLGVEHHARGLKILLLPQPVLLVAGLELGHALPPLLLELHLPFLFNLLKLLFRQPAMELPLEKLVVVLVAGMVLIALDARHAKVAVGLALLLLALQGVVVAVAVGGKVALAGNLRLLFLRALVAVGLRLRKRVFAGLLAAAYFAALPIRVDRIEVALPHLIVRVRHGCTAFQARLFQAKRSSKEVGIAAGPAARLESRGLPVVALIVAARLLLGLLLVALLLARQAQVALIGIGVLAGNLQAALRHAKLALRHAKLPSPQGKLVGNLLLALPKLQAAHAELALRPKLRLRELLVEVIQGKLVLLHVAFGHGRGNARTGQTGGSQGLLAQAQSVLVALLQGRLLGVAVALQALLYLPVKLPHGGHSRHGAGGRLGDREGRCGGRCARLHVALDLEDHDFLLLLIKREWLASCSSCRWQCRPTSSLR